jgi:hypothetical protein
MKHAEPRRSPLRRVVRALLMPADAACRRVGLLVVGAVLVGAGGLAFALGATTDGTIFLLLIGCTFATLGVLTPRDGATVPARGRRVGRTGCARPAQPAATSRAAPVPSAQKPVAA